MAELKAFTGMQAQNITVRFGSTTILDSVDFSVQPGEVHALLGENGAGKSTLMKVFAGALRPAHGKMLINGTQYAPSNPMEGRQAGVAIIYQELSLVPHLTVEENICLGLEPSRGPFLDRTTMKKRAIDALAKLGHKDISLSARAASLSASEQQLVEIARAIATGCRVLILDEPTSSLTRPDVLTLFALLENLKQQNYAIIYISHFIEEVQEVADRFTILTDGKVTSSGDPKKASADEIIALMVGNKIEEIYHRSEHRIGQPVLELRKLTGEILPKNVSLTLRAGEVLGIAGLLGSGRTELVRSIFGLDVVRSGTIRVLQYSGWSKPVVRWQQGVGYISENRKDEGIALSMNVADNIILPSVSRLEARGFLSPSRKNDTAEKWIEKLSIKCQGPHSKLNILSGGNQQKVSLARLLNHEVDVLLLDEPTRGVDLKTKTQIYSLIDELAKQGKSILMISSYLPELLGVCDRIAIMHRGHLSDARNASELTERELMLETVASRPEEDAP
jgi:ribose transport system ATP-binding protein